MVQSTAPRLRFQFFRLQQQAAAGPGLGLDGILPDATVQQVLKEEGVNWKLVFYTPWLTFWAFFWQALEPRSLLPRRRQADRRLAGAAR